MFNIKIISLEEYIRKNDSGFILISSLDYAEEIAKILGEHEIHNYAKCPWMQAFFLNSQDIINKMDLKKYNTIAFYQRNPFTEQIVNCLKSTKIVYIANEKKIEISNETPIIIINVETEETIKNIKKMYQNNKILDLKTIYKMYYSFKNEKLLKFKDIYKGKRCFIIGNGPSLSYQDLDKLYENKEICFGVNRIYLAYEFTKWRPNFYVAVDNIVIGYDREKINELPGVKFIRHINNMPKWENEDMIYEFGNLHNNVESLNFSSNIIEGIYNGYTVIYEAIQIAFYMGFKEIYLLGVDMTENIRAEDEGAHFYASPNKNENLGQGDTKSALKAFKFARQVIEGAGRKIKNATRVGNWTEIERVSFDSLFT